MDAGTQLRKAVANFFDVDEGQVGPSFSLQGCQGSIARAALDAAIRRGAGIKSPGVYTARTFGELSGDVVADDLPASTTVPTASSPTSPGSSTAGASCGVDIELVEHLPVVADPWEDPFYRSHFSPSEIAYCLRQSEPLTHFAARWCAKEALKKCDRAFLAVEGKDVEVAHDETGAPHLAYLAGGSPGRLPHAVSLSHTPHAAVAMVVRVVEPPVPPPAPLAPSTIEPAPVPAIEVVAPRRSRWGSAPRLVLDLITLGLAAAALYRTFPGLRWPFAG